jgi:hypothetical protein
MRKPRCNAPSWEWPRREKRAPSVTPSSGADRPWSPQTATPLRFASVATMRKWPITTQPGSGRGHIRKCLRLYDRAGRTWPQEHDSLNARLPIRPVSIGTRTRRA